MLSHSFNFYRQEIRNVTPSSTLQSSKMIPFKLVLVLLPCSFMALPKASCALSTGNNEGFVPEVDSQQQVKRESFHQWKKWRPNSFPNPIQDSDACSGGLNHRICDPDSVLKELELVALWERIQLIEQTQAIICHDSNEPIEVGIALVQKMDLAPFGSFKDKEAKAAESFAIYLHDEWGVGKKTSCGGTGIFFFLSTRDRAMFLSRGGATKSVLTNGRVDSILDTVRPMLRLEDYSGAILEVLEQIEHYIALGEPTAEETRQEMLQCVIPLAIFFGIILLFVFRERHDRQEHLIYAKVESQLSELDRSRAEALQGRYDCTSCPICLEAFPPEPTPGLTKNGSDMLPLKLLRCGHVFDETCWNEWINSGQGTVRRCPICQQDVGLSKGNNSDTCGLIQNNRMQQDDNQMQQENNMMQQQNNNMYENRIFRQYLRERNFRLARMSAQFPRYVRPEQIQRWTTASTYDDTLLARDPEFIQSNPSLVRASTARKTTSSIRSFGGGSSAGGRGGRW